MTFFMEYVLFLMAVVVFAYFITRIVLGDEEKYRVTQLASGCFVPEVKERGDIRYTPITNTYVPFGYTCDTFEKAEQLCKDYASGKIVKYPIYTKVKV